MEKNGVPRGKGYRRVGIVKQKCKEITQNDDTENKTPHEKAVNGKMLSRQRQRGEVEVNQNIMSNRKYRFLPTSTKMKIEKEEDAIKNKKSLTTRKGGQPLRSHR